MTANTPDDLFGIFLYDPKPPPQQDQFSFVRAERDLCNLCDANGYRPNGIVCDHIDRTAVAARGIALCRDVLKLAALKRAADMPDQPDTTETEECPE